MPSMALRQYMLNTVAGIKTSNGSACLSQVQRGNKHKTKQEAPSN